MKENGVKVHSSAILYKNVELGEGSIVGPYVIIGEPPRGADDGEFPTIIGKNAVIRSHTVIYAGNKIGDNFQSGHKVNIRENNEIGQNVSIGTHSVIEHHVKLHDGVRIHSNVFIPEFSEIEEEAWIGPNVVITNALHPLCPDTKKCMKGATIKRRAKVGANATLVPDITIGEMALVGAGAVVVGDVEPRAVVVGNPAKKIKEIEELKCPYDIRETPY